MRGSWCAFAIAALSTITASAGAAQQVFVSVGADGEVSFSDVPSADAAPLEIDAPAARSADIELTQRRMAAIRAVAEDLEDARRARDASRNANTHAVAPPWRVEPAPADADPYEDRFVYPWDGYDAAPPPPATIEPAPPLPERAPFEPAFRPGRPAFQPAPVER